MYLLYAGLVLHSPYKKHKCPLTLNPLIHMYTKVFCLKDWIVQGGGWGGGDLHEIPFVVGVWIFSGTTHWPRGFSLHSSQLVVEVTVGNNTMANRTTIA